MKLTKKDIELFQALSKSTLGQDLADYLSRVEAHIYDSRSWGKDDTRESSSHAARVLKQFVTEKLISHKTVRKIINESE